MIKSYHKIYFYHSTFTLFFDKILVHILKLDIIYTILGWAGFLILSFTYADYRIFDTHLNKILMRRNKYDLP